MYGGVYTVVSHFRFDRKQATHDLANRRVPISSPFGLATHPLLMAIVLSTSVSACGSSAAAPSLDDAATDASVDAAVPSEPSVDPHWIPMPGLPAGCVVERAEHPEGLFTPVWTTEPDCGTGCQHLALPPPDKYWSFDWRSAWTHGGETYFAMSEVSTVDPLITLILARTKGAPIAAWRFPARRSNEICQIVSMAYGDGDVAFALGVGDETTAYREYIYRAPLERIREVTRPIQTLGEGWNPHGWPTANIHVSGQWTVVSTPTDKFAFMSDNRILALDGTEDFQTGWILALDSNDIFWQNIDTFLDYSTNIRTEPQLRIRVTRGNVFGRTSYVDLGPSDADVIGVSITPSHFSWVEAYELAPPRRPDRPDEWPPRWARYELWTGDTMSEGSPIHRHKLLDLESSSMGAFGGEDFYAQQGACPFTPRDCRYHDLNVWDLRDGRHLVYDAPEGPPYGEPDFGAPNPINITNSEILAIAPQVVPWDGVWTGHDVCCVDTLMRLRIDALEEASNVP